MKDLVDRFLASRPKQSGFPRCQEPPKPRVFGFSVKKCSNGGQQSQGYRLYKTIRGQRFWLYLGKHFDVRKAEQKVIEFCLRCSFYFRYPEDCMKVEFLCEDGTRFDDFEKARDHERNYFVDKLTAAKGDQKELNEIFNKLVASGLAGEVRKRPGRKRKEVAAKDAPIPGFE